MLTGFIQDAVLKNDQVAVNEGNLNGNQTTKELSVDELTLNQTANQTGD